MNEMARGESPKWEGLLYFDEGRFMIRILALTALAVMLSGCAEIGTINGVRMNATTSSDDTFCSRNDDNRRLCILLGAGFIGGLGGIFLANQHHHTTPPAQSPPPQPPPLQ